MIVVVTRDVPGRFRGFLASAMLELAPGVYTAPAMNAGVRKRVWEVLQDWFFAAGRQGSIVMTWKDDQSPSGQGLLTLGLPAKDVIAYEGLYLVRQAL